MFTGDLGRYLGVGRSALTCISTALTASGHRPDHVRRVLDLPCGHGRVLRYLKAAFPGAEITAGDLLRDGVDYCAERYGAVALYSNPDPEAIPFNTGPFDLIWVGSLFTHFDRDQWAPFLAVLARNLAPGGVLIFTAHGRRSHHWLTHGRWNYDLNPGRVESLLRDHGDSGFGYVNYAGTLQRYGVSLSSPAWVLNLLAGLGRLRVTLLAEHAWDNHQDVYACVPDEELESTEPHGEKSPGRWASLGRKVRKALGLA
jgi:SAM-dependent methyltransferase